MIAFVSGQIIDIDDNRLVVEQQGIGYGVYVPYSIIDRVSDGDEVRLFTYLSVKEDAMTLYGFLTKDDYKTFKMLLGVNGIGPKVALSVLSTLSADELRMAILADDIKTISSVPGLGKKTAQKLVLELKDKMNLAEVIESKFDNTNPVPQRDTSASSEAVMALTALGYSGTSALKAVRKVTESQPDLSTEAILKLALKFIQ
ncbi:MAG: Holliday junction branch migration protein RuvA [Lachnospiraceae bacterium]|nr:Holliday junction branch migration protein RuvA [Candidatus Equihabitans merdae]